MEILVIFSFDGINCTMNKYNIGSRGYKKKKKKTEDYSRCCKARILFLSHSVNLKCFNLEFVDRLTNVVHCDGVSYSFP